MNDMNGLTITQAKKYVGYTQKTWLTWIQEGKVNAKKGDGETDAWFIPREEVERIRLKAIEKLQNKINAISTPVPIE